MGALLDLVLSGHRKDAAASVGKMEQTNRQRRSCASKGGTMRMTKRDRGRNRWAASARERAASARPRPMPGSRRESEVMPL